MFHFVFLVYTFRRKKQATWILLFVGIGWAYVFEYFVLNVFKMYTYSPKVFKNKWMDSVFGALLSQALFIPIAAAFLTFFRLGWKWKIVTSLFYGLVERLFIRWNIFKNRTWRTTYTVAFIPIHFWIVEKWWERLKRNPPNWLIFLSIFFTYWVNYTNIYYFLVVLFRTFLFRTGLVRNKFWDHFIMAPLYTLYLGTIGTITTVMPNRKGKILGLLWLHLSDRLLYRLGLLKLKNWSIYTFLPIHFVMLSLGEYISSLLLRLRND